MKIVVSILFCVFIASNISIFAQEKEKIKNPILTNKFEVEVGAFFSLKSIRLSGYADLPDYEIDFKDALDLSDYKSTFFANFDWRFSKMWKLSAEYLGIKSTNTATLKEDFQLGDYLFEQPTTVTLGTGMKLYRIFVGRVITKGEKHEFGAGLGVHAMKFDLSIEGKAKINGVEHQSAKAETNVTLPLPNVVVWYTFAPTEKWSFEARTDWFGIKIDDISGLLWDIEPKVNYEITKNFGLGASYRFFKLTAEADVSEWNGKFEMQYKGPTFSLHGRF